MPRPAHPAGAQGPDAAAPASSGGSAVAFDTWQVGVVWRAVLWVHACVAAMALLGADSLTDAWARLAMLTGAIFPAAIGWLVLLGALARLRPAWPPQAWQAAGGVLGAGAGVLASAVLVGIGFTAARPGVWLGSAAAGALAAAGVGVWLQWRLRARHPAVERARLTELQSRIRPHFLFNTLNSAMALVRRDAARAEEVLQDLSDLFRAALDDPREQVSLQDEVDLARRYLSIEQARFAERLDVHWMIEPGALDALVPRLLLQPLLENAVRHGVEPSEQGARIEVRAWCRAGRVGIEVRNTVPGGPGEPGLGLGLRSVHERLSLLHDVQVRQHIGLHNGWFGVRLDWPATHRPPGAT